jgi:hypothetical protein
VLIKVPANYDLRKLSKLKTRLPEAGSFQVLDDKHLVHRLDQHYVDRVVLLGCEDSEKGEVTPKARAILAGIEILATAPKADRKQEKKVLEETIALITPPQRQEIVPMKLSRKLPVGAAVQLREEEEEAEPEPEKAAVVVKKERKVKKETKEKKKRKKKEKK